MEKKESRNTIFGIIYRVFYIDDTGRNREKTLRLDLADDTMYFFYNVHNQKTEAIPKRVISRMEAETTIGGSK